jgi:succinate dehydrogenase flavin-adding protein (antitoxin of CptAB toxin-antitoxin module)
MENYREFQPNNEEERKLVEMYNNLSQYISEKIRGLDEKDRLTVLRQLKQTDLSLMNLYLQALKKEDYETCAVAKTLLVERGFKIPD